MSGVACSQLITPAEVIIIMSLLIYFTKILAQNPISFSGRLSRHEYCLLFLEKWPTKHVVVVVARTSRVRRCRATSESRPSDEQQVVCRRNANKHKSPIRSLTRSLTHFFSSLDRTPREHCSGIVREPPLWRRSAQVSDAPECAPHLCAHLCCEPRRQVDRLQMRRSISRLWDTI